MTPQQFLDSSKTRLQVTEQFIAQTYPAVQEPRLLVSALQGLLQAMDDLLSALLGAARAAGAIPQYHESFAGKLAAMQSEAMRRRYALSSLDAHMLSEMHEIVEEHKKAATIFPRNGTLVVADDNFQLRTLSVEKLKTYLERSKSLYTKLYDALTRNPELFA